MDWHEIIFIKSSKNRRAILKALQKKPMTPTELSKELNNHRSTISQNLIKLEKKKIVECLTPKNKNYRVYCITGKGQKLLKKI
ncbi:MAG: winged helix-turn-helix domain-containing protein [archaeon]